MVFVVGYDMEYPLLYQVVNYGLGGHYEPHFDFARVSPQQSCPIHCCTVRVIYVYVHFFPQGEEDAFSSLGTGNRVATVLFYVSQSDWLL